MTHNEKTACLIEALQDRGVGQYTTAPPHYRLLWRLGWEIRPPIFQHFVTQWISSGAYFAIVWGVLTWILVWRNQDMGIADAVIKSVSTGALFGLFMAIYFRRKKHKLGLSSWEAYPDTLDDERPKYGEA